MQQPTVILLLIALIFGMNKAAHTKSMVTKIFQTSWRGEGKGATVRRAIGVPELQDLDPFLMLDFFKVRLPAGFPDHPHRGFETVTYMISGTFKHEDFKGNKGLIKPGDIQWMTAGKGIVHAEMPGSKTEDSIGFQLWINLPKEKKMAPAKYQDYPKEQIPNFVDENHRVVVIAGKYRNVESLIKPESTAHYYDVHLKPSANFEQEIPEDWNGMIYAYTETPFEVDGQEVKVNHACVFKGQNRAIIVRNLSATQEGKFIIIYGRPLKEPISKYGPFVMNTQSEIHKTFEDYQEAKNGFENADVWGSEIQHLANA